MSPSRINHDPVVKTGDKALKLGAQIAQQGIQRLENAKIKAGDDQMTRFEGQAGSGPCRSTRPAHPWKGHRQHKQFGKTHDGIAPLSSFFFTVCRKLVPPLLADHGVAGSAEGVRHLAEDPKSP